MSGYRRQLEAAKEEAERQAHHLSHTRESLNTVTEEAALLRKQLEVRAQEIEATKREASNVLR